MPGNPLPELTKNLKDSNFIYTPEEGWVNPSVSAAPKAVFDAASGMSLKQSGVLRSTQGDPDSMYPIVDTPEGEKAYRIFYGAFDNPLRVPGPDKKIQHELLIPTRETWHHFQIRQPDNFTVKRQLAFEISSLDDVTGWNIGDTLTTNGGGSGIVYYIGSPPNGSKLYVVVDDYGIGNPELRWKEGRVVTNTVTGTTATSLYYDLLFGNSKFIAAWADDFEGQWGYENAAFHLGFAPSYHVEGNNGLVYSTASQSTDGTMSGFSFTNNELAGEPDLPALFDVEDNGCKVEIIAHFKRSTAIDSYDAEMDVYKKVHRAGSPHAELTHLFRDSGLHVYTNFSDNNFTCQYIFGNKNHNYPVDTEFGLYRYELWFQKPTVLINGGF